MAPNDVEGSAIQEVKPEESDFVSSSPMLEVVFCHHVKDAIIDCQIGTVPPNRVVIHGARNIVGVKNKMDWIRWIRAANVPVMFYCTNPDHIQKARCELGVYFPGIVATNETGR